MIDRHLSVDPFRFEGESLRYMFKDHIEITEVIYSENNLFQHCKIEYHFPNRQISFVIAGNYPWACARVTVHHKACKVNIPYILRAHTDWSNGMCEHPTCCQDLMDIQVFLQRIAERFTGTFSLMAVILTAKKDIQYTENEGFRVRANIRGDG
ncbi:hypothetical protein XU18_0765 [Perkinsela sp. CCAP 1560/4]|nr:hypothetical protein XU18_0765 [Perkinsela sp. CCAP 1560/4]|eukprot:KNH08771.1 hypothetical protein XU18_0765 [Perkinsela sp. CCAP 1560/4]